MKTISIILIAAAAALAVTGVLGFSMIPWLRKVKFGGTVLDSEDNRFTVPTMGGLMIIIGTCCAILLAVITDKISGGNIVSAGSLIPEEMFTKLWSGIVMALAFSLIGFMDDYKKIFTRRNLGLTIKEKSVMQFFVSLSYLVGLYMGMNGAPHMFIPFRGTVEPMFFFWVIGLILVYAAVNAVNATDGVDGVCGSATLIAAVSIAAIAAMKGLFGFTMAGAALAGSCLGFVLWNKKPARVHMGKTGSMFLGGMLVALCYGIGSPLILILVGIAFFIDGGSSVLQIVYFRKTGGKKLLKMAPLHRHLEICGWSADKITLMFTAVNVAGGVVAALLMFYGGYVMK